MDFQETLCNLSLQDARIQLGGRTGPFVPNLNCYKWHDECFLNINNISVQNRNDPAQFDGKIVMLESGGQIQKWYITEDGMLEYEILVEKKLPKNQLIFEIKGRDLSFNYQGELTSKQKDMRIVRPKDIVGSYAVYHATNKANNQYKTGKFCHIKQPIIIDIDGNQLPAQMKIINGQMIINIPDDLKYPILIDPVLGWSSEGASGEYPTNNTQVVSNSSITDGTGGNIDDFNVYLAETSPGGSFKMGCYPTVFDTPDYKPDGQTLIEQISDSTPADGLNTNTGAGGALSANTYYAIAWIHSSNGDPWQLKLDSTQAGWSDSKYDDLTYANEMLATRDTRNDWDNDLRYSMYINYSPPATDWTTHKHSTIVFT